jgi:uncharacterized membrane protein YcaP (DUF421 family)
VNPTGRQPRAAERRDEAALRWRRAIGPLAAFVLPFLVFYLLAPRIEPWLGDALRAMFGRDSAFLPQILVRVPVMFVFTLLAVRFGGKRHVSDLGPFDFIITLAAASAVGDAVLYEHVPLSHAIVVVGMLFFLQFLFTTFPLGWIGLKNTLEGEPTRLVADGRVLDDALAAERLDRDTLAAELRKHGVADPGQVEAAYLERDGTVSVIRRDEK